MKNLYTNIVSTHRKGKKHMPDAKLKEVIRKEISDVTNLLIAGGSSNAVIITKWLQSLQRIDEVCKNRNRY